MKRGTKCVARTINLSNPETCVRPKRIQKLVEPDVLHPCPNAAGSGASYWTPRPVTIKICTRKEMERTCPPKLCDCPQKVPANTVGQRLRRALVFLLKSGIAAGLVYWTHSEGLWGSSDDVEDLYRRIMITIGSDPDQIELPRVSEYKYRMTERYNRAVFTIINYIVAASTMLRSKVGGITADVEPPEAAEPSDDGDDPTDTEEES
ncbi:uncharacterized protein LOC143431361 [Xylocopa sonorina]|uniref:uncharacterized protein LOC143431361 n=1 Tax=Xylocopa sonorina TaxID=1818115 RepID=UPI00403AF088